MWEIVYTINGGHCFVDSAFALYVLLIRVQPKTLGTVKHYCPQCGVEVEYNITKVGNTTVLICSQCGLTFLEGEVRRV